MDDDRRRRRNVSLFCATATAPQHLGMCGCLAMRSTMSERTSETTIAPSTDGGAWLRNWRKTATATKARTSDAPLAMCVHVRVCLRAVLCLRRRQLSTESFCTDARAVNRPRPFERPTVGNHARHDVRILAGSGRFECRNRRHRSRSCRHRCVHSQSTLCENNNDG